MVGPLSPEDRQTKVHKQLARVFHTWGYLQHPVLVYGEGHSLILTEQERDREEVLRVLRRYLYIFLTEK